MSKYTLNHPIYNSNPLEGKLRQIGWKTVNGWNYEAKKLAYCLCENHKSKPYFWHITINLHEVLTDEEHKQIWKTATKYLRKNFAAFWVREPDKNNHVNYHLLVNSEISESRLRECLNVAVANVKNTHTVARIYSAFGLSQYLVKLRYPENRLYFAQYCTLNKHGTIGQFWVKPQKQMWQKAIDRERKIAAFSSDNYDDLRHAVKFLHWLIDGYFTMKIIRRNLCLFGVKNILTALADKWQTEYIDYGF